MWEGWIKGKEQRLKRHKVLLKKKKKYCQKGPNQSIHKTVWSIFLNREITKARQFWKSYPKSLHTTYKIKVNLLTEKILFHQVFCTEYCKGNKKYMERIKMVRLHCQNVHFKTLKVPVNDKHYSKVWNMITSFY